MDSQHGHSPEAHRFYESSRFLVLTPLPNTHPGSAPSQGLLRTDTGCSLLGLGSQGRWLPAGVETLGLTQGSGGSSAWRDAGSPEALGGVPLCA